MECPDSREKVGGLQLGQGSTLGGGGHYTGAEQWAASPEIGHAVFSSSPFLPSSGAGGTQCHSRNSWPTVFFQ